MRCLRQAVASDAKAVVLACAGRTFVAGADIREFGRPPEEPHLPDVVDALVDCPLPVIAALHGTVLGGGLELALGCHFRVAVENTRFGMPEVNLGLIPGAGGTQRLPRLVGIDAATDMITSGRMIDTARALEIGLIDSLVNDDLLQAACDFARMADASKFRDQADTPMKSDAHDEAWFEAKAATLQRRARGQESPLAALSSIRNVLTHNLEAGIAAEREIFMGCKQSAQSDALRHVFFAERATVGDINLKLAGPKTAAAGVIGAGTMGSGIALALANAGISVALIETKQENLDRGMATIQGSLAKAVQLGKLSEQEAKRRCDLVTPSTDYATLSDADVVVEAVFESLEVKNTVFESLDAHCKTDAILATNTSYLDINAIAAVVDDPTRVVGLHFFSPADRMPLLEVVRAQTTSDKTLASAMKLGKRIGKIAVPVGVCFGFAANRSYTAYQGAGQQLLLEGVSPERLDLALTQWGMAMGPCAVLDMSGIDIGHSARAQNPNPPADPRWFAPANALVEAGDFGRKTGAGFYDYSNPKKPVPNARALDLIAAAAKRLDVSPREYSDEEIVERVMQALATECDAIVREGIVTKADDMDVVWVNGYGFPRWRGGPMFAARRA